jgi:hypothetical protein
MSRSDCCLCDEAKAIVSQVADGEEECTWEVVNVDSGPELAKRYGMDIPVILINGIVYFKHRVTHASLVQAVHEATLASGAQERVT